jgi:hypothetical protein
MQRAEEEFWSEESVFLYIVVLGVVHDFVT